MSLRLAGRARRLWDVFAVAMSFLRRLTKIKKRAKRRRRHTRKVVLPLYLSAPSRPPAACDIDLPLDSIAHALRVGSGLGSVRTSLLQDSLAQLRSAEANNSLTPEGKKLTLRVERQLLGRSLSPPP